MHRRFLPGWFAVTVTSSFGFGAYVMSEGKSGVELLLLGAIVFAFQVGAHVGIAEGREAILKGDSQ